jgi:hypothetical protein
MCLCVCVSSQILKTRIVEPDEMAITIPIPIPILTKGSSPMAHCKPLMLVTPLDAEAPIAQTTTPHLQDVIAAARPNITDKEIRELEELITEYEDTFVMNGSAY